MIISCQVLIAFSIVAIDYWYNIILLTVSHGIYNRDREQKMNEYTNDNMNTTNIIIIDEIWMQIETSRKS